MPHNNRSVLGLGVVKGSAGIGPAWGCQRKGFTRLPRVVRIGRLCQTALVQQGRSAMQDLIGLAERVGARLKARGETIAIAESSAGGLIAAALLSVGGASAYFAGGAVIYTRAARRGLLNIKDADMPGIRPSTEAYAALLARRVRQHHGSVWGLGETGATGPTGNRYGDAAGHCCIGLSGPLEIAITLETASTDRQANMRAFAARALGVLDEALGK
jgi:nicotinamide-nucleotide amidase